MKKEKLYEVGLVITETWWFSVSAKSKKEALWKVRNENNAGDVVQTCSTAGGTKDTVRLIKGRS